MLTWAPQRWRSPDILIPDEEIRFGTVFFADLVDSSATVTAHGPEAALDIIDEAIGLASECVQRFGGTVNRVTGDGVMAMFGAPVGMAEHALAACSAALDLQDRLARARHRIAMRVGINTGEFLIHPLRVTGVHALDATGAVVHLAARLQQAAQPGETLISRSTQHAAGARLITDALPAMAVRGFAEAQDVQRLTGAHLHLTRFEAALGELSHFFNRDHEAAALVAALAHAVDGAGSAILLTGDGGMGKTRLVQQLASSAPAGVRFLPLQVLRWRQEVELHPFEPLLPDPAAEDAAAWARLEPSERRGRMIETVVHAVLARADDAPTVAVLDDMHWADDATVQAVEALLPRLRGRRLLLLLLSRPDHRLGPVITALPTLTLSPLSGEDAAGLALDRGLDLARAHVVAERSGGNPFFVEQAAAAGDNLPPEIRGLLTERVDMLRPGARELLRTLAVIEEPVTLTQLAAGMAPAMTLAAVERHVQALDRAGLLLREGLGTAARLTPRHALLQEVVYRGLTQRRQRDRHAWVAQRIASLPGAHPDMLARHTFLGGMWLPALEHNEAAARRALARYANREAVCFLDRAITALENMEPSQARLDRAIDLRLLLRDPLFRLGESARLAERLEEAGALAARAGEYQRIAALRIFQIHHAWLSGDVARAEQLLALTEDQAAGAGDAALLLRCLFQRGLLDLATDRHAAAERAMATVAREATDPRHAGRYGLDAALSVVALGYQSRMLTELGDQAGARQQADACMASAQAVGRPFSWIFAVLADGYALHGAGHSQAAVLRLTEALALCDKAESDMMRVAVLTLLGTAELAAGEAHSAAGHLRTAIDLAEGMRFMVQQSWRQTLLAKALQAVSTD